MFQHLYSYESPKALAIVVDIDFVGLIINPDFDNELSILERELIRNVLAYKAGEGLTARDRARVLLRSIV